MGKCCWFCNVLGFDVSIDGNGDVYPRKRKSHLRIWCPFVTPTFSNVTFNMPLLSSVSYLLGMLAPWNSGSITFLFFTKWCCHAPWNRVILLTIHRVFLIAQVLLTFRRMLVHTLFQDRKKENCTDVHCSSYRSIRKSQCGFSVGNQCTKSTTDYRV